MLGFDPVSSLSCSDASAVFYSETNGEIAATGLVDCSIGYFYATNGLAVAIPGESVQKLGYAYLSELTMALDGAAREAQGFFYASELTMALDGAANTLFGPSIYMTGRVGVCGVSRNSFQRGRPLNSAIPANAIVWYGHNSIPIGKVAFVAFNRSGTNYKLIGGESISAADQRFRSDEVYNDNRGAIAAAKLSEATAKLAAIQECLTSLDN